MKSAVLRFLAWLADLIAGLFRKRADQEDSKEDSKKIDEADDHIKDEPVDPNKRPDDDIFDNKNW